MNGRNEESLKDLFEKFFGSKEAKRAIEDIVKGEQILGEQAAPEPDKELIVDIKAGISKALLRRKSNLFKRAVYKSAAVAAVVIIVATVSVKLSEQGGKESKRPVAASIIPKVIWESDNVAEDDTDLAILATEIEQIESELLAVRLGENGGNGNGTVTELEVELIEIDSDFWKG